MGLTWTDLWYDWEAVTASAKEVMWQPPFICLTVNKTPLKVLKGFYWHAQRRLVVGQGRDDWILVMFGIVEGFWPLIFHRSKAKLQGQGALIGNLYHYCLYIHIPPHSTTGVKVMNLLSAILKVPLLLYAGAHFACMQSVKRRICFKWSKDDPGFIKGLHLSRRRKTTLKKK